MIRSFVINKYLSKEFCKVIINAILIFFCLGFIMNLFEEINYFKDLDIKIYLPILLSLLIVPSLLYNMLPFIVLISGIWFFLKMRKSDEITAMKISGMSNFSVILIPSIISIAIGILFVTSINPITSVLVKNMKQLREVMKEIKITLRQLLKMEYGLKKKILKKIIL